MKNRIKVVYQARTADRLELIVAQFDNIADLAQWAEVDERTLRKMLKKHMSPRKNHIFFEKFIIYDNNKKNF